MKCPGDRHSSRIKGCKEEIKIKTGTILAACISPTGLAAVAVKALKSSGAEA
jgi:hypothetical protein